MPLKFSPPLFEVDRLNFGRGGITVLKSVSFTILPGEYCAVIGPNGGGKTTLIRLLLGLERASSGSIKLFGTPQHRFDAWSRIGYVPQRSALLDSSFPATVREVVAMGRYSKRGLFGFETEEDANAIREAMELMAVSDLQERLIGNLSGGQRQRVMIARALASNPDVLIVDEPNTGVDAQSQHRFYELLRQLNRKQQVSILFVTHDVGVIAEDVTKVLFVNQTLLASKHPHDFMQCDSISVLYGNPSHVVTHDH
ncbi:MAG: metal ABC transporter ATP-binding protein [Sulfuricurvum sp.]